MIQESEQEENNFTAHEMALQLKETMQDTLTEMGVSYSSKESKGAANDLIQVTADDFDNYDHYSAKNPKASAANQEEEAELNRQRVSHITRIE